MEQLMRSRSQRRPGRIGVVAWLEPQDDGRVLLVFDDVRATAAGCESSWQSECFFTEREFEGDEIFDVTASEGALADIGLAVVSRLASRTPPRDDKGSDMDH